MDIDNLELFETFIRSHFFTDNRIDSKEGEKLAKNFIFICDNRGFIDSTTGETFYKIPYTELTKTIYEVDSQNFSITSFTMLRQLIDEKINIILQNALTGEHDSDEDIKQRTVIIGHYRSCYHRLVEHILLARTQKEYMEKIASDIDESSKRAIGIAEEAETRSKDITVQFVTILGIFASIIVALFGGMSLIKAAVGLLTNEGSIPIFIFVVATLLLSFTILLVLLTSWITSLNTKKTCSYNLMKGTIFIGLLSVIAVSGAFIFTMKDSKPNSLKQQKTDIEFKISADKVN